MRHARRRRPDAFLDCAWVPPPRVEVAASSSPTARGRAVDGLSLTVRARRAARPARTERRRQDHHDRDLRGLPPADAGTVRVLGLDPIATRPRCARGSGVMLQDGVGGYTAAKARRAAASCSPPTPPDPHDRPTLLDRVGLAEVAATAVRAAVRRAAAAALARPRAGRPSRARLPRRADRRHGPAGAARHLGPHPRSCAPTASASCSPRTSSTRPSSSPTGRRDRRGTGRRRGHARPSSPAPAPRGRSGSARRTGLRLDRAARRAAARDARASRRRRGATWSRGDVTPQLLATLTAWCAAQDVLAEDLAVERRSLEDVFLDLTGRELRA